MIEGFPPLLLAQPESRKRRNERSGVPPLPPEVRARRAEIAKILKIKVEQLSKRLKTLTDAERRAVFYKLEHDAPVTPNTLSGTDLKPIAQPSPDVIFAVAKSDNFDQLIAKVDQFAAGPEIKQHVPNEWLANLREIKEADPKDRLSGDLRDNYSALIKSKWVICEVELFSLLQGPKQQKREIESWLSDLQKVFASGVHGNYFEHELMLPTCRAVIRCTGQMFRRLVEEPEWIQRIRWIESRPRFQTFSEVLEAFRMQDLAEITSPPSDAPVVCVVDSGVTAGNPFLKKIIHPTLSKSFLKRQPDNPNDENGHGSAVASLASYYSLNLASGAENQPRAWIASARILDADNQIEDERLFSKVLEEVVHHFANQGVRIFCLAVGDARKIWTDSTRRSSPRNSWVARRIDQLAREYDVVFLTCTGNLDLSDLNHFAKDGKYYPVYLAEEAAQLLDPGQAALALTVGSVSPGTKLIAAKNTRAIALRNQPSPFTRSGPGIRREIKPEVVEYGGNLAWDESMNHIRENRGLQVVAASKQLTPAISFWTGTSFAVPRVAHRLALIDQDLRSLGISPTASLLKAFLVNSTMQSDDDGAISAIQEHFTADEHRHQVRMLLGHGLPDHNRATESDDYSVIAYFQGEIEPNQVLFFDVPVPSALSQTNDRRRLTVTVCHAPEVQRWGLERYFAADLKWRMFRGDKSRDEIVDAMSEPSDESDVLTQRELFVDEENETDDTVLPKELAFKPGFIQRSRGTVQQASFTWTQHRKEFSDGHYTLAIAAHKRWQKRVKDIPIAVVVRLEDLGRQVAIYNDVKTSIDVQTAT